MCLSSLNEYALCLCYNRDYYAWLLEADFERLQIARLAIQISSWPIFKLVSVSLAHALFTGGEQSWNCRFRGRPANFAGSFAAHVWRARSSLLGFHAHAKVACLCALTMRAQSVRRCRPCRNAHSAHASGQCLSLSAHTSNHHEHRNWQQIARTNKASERNYWSHLAMRACVCVVYEALSVQTSFPHLLIGPIHIGSARGVVFVQNRLQDYDDILSGAQTRCYCRSNLCLLTSPKV